MPELNMAESNYVNWIADEAYPLVQVSSGKDGYFSEWIPGNKAQNICLYVRWGTAVAAGKCIVRWYPTKTIAMATPAIGAYCGHVDYADNAGQDPHAASAPMWQARSMPAEIASYPGGFRLELYGVTATKTVDAILGMAQL